MKRLSAVVVGAALALVLFNFGCEQPQPVEPVAQNPEPVQPPPYPYSQVPDAEPLEPADQPADAPALSKVEDSEVEIQPITTIDEPVAAQPKPAAKPKVTTAKPKENYAPAKKATRTYTVRKNDTLQKISMKFYGTTKNFRKIYDANRDKLKNPDIVPVGTKLVIP